MATRDGGATTGARRVMDSIVGPMTRWRLRLFPHFSLEETDPSRSRLNRFIASGGLVQ